MQNVRQLSISVGIATLIVTAGAVVLMAITFKISPAPVGSQKEIVGAAAVFLPMGVATWWIFRSSSDPVFCSARRVLSPLLMQRLALSGLYWLWFLAKYLAASRNIFWVGSLFCQAYSSGSLWWQRF
jgi:hypothetical protein